MRRSESWVSTTTERECQCIARDWIPENPTGYQRLSHSSPINQPIKLSFTFELKQLFADSYTKSGRCQLIISIDFGTRVASIVFDFYGQICMGYSVSMATAEKQGIAS